VDCSDIKSALRRDTLVDIPDFPNIREWRSEWMSNAFHTESSTASMSELIACEFFAKAPVLPGVNTTTSIDQFVDFQRGAERACLREDVLRYVAESLHHIMGRYSEVEASVLMRHGPGSIAEGHTGHDKWLVPAPDLPIVNSFDPLCRLPRSSYVPRTSLVSVVPKTSWTDRVICIEHCWNQAIQQGIGRLLSRRLLAIGIDLSTRWRRNQELIMVSPEYATIDLSAASDSITTGLCNDLMDVPGNHVDWLQAMFCARSDFYSDTRKPTGQLAQLRSFASMGNGFCFVLLSCVCMAACVAARHIANGSRGPVLRSEVVSSFKTDFSVFGDDIVSDSKYVPHLRYVLQSLGFSLNTEKSSGCGPLRETCGAYALWSRSRLIFRRGLPRLRSNWDPAIDSLPSLCSLQRTLYRLHYHHTASAIRGCILDSRYGHLVVSTPRSEDIHETDAFVVLDSSARDSSRWNKRLSRREIPCYSLRSVTRDAWLADHVGWGASIRGVNPDESTGKMRLALSSLGLG